MYWEEKIINGVLCYRNSPDKEFTPYTATELTQKLTARDRQWREKVEAVLADLRAEIDDCGDEDCDVCAGKACASTDIRIAFAELLEDK